MLIYPDIRGLLLPLLTVDILCSYYEEDVDKHSTCGFGIIQKPEGPVFETDFFFILRVEL